MNKEKVLIVEDDKDIREGVRILLESEGYIVKEAENGRQGLELLDEETDLVILDIMMPGISGLRTCEEIRKVSNVPVLFLTQKPRSRISSSALWPEGTTICQNLSPTRSFWEESRPFSAVTIFIWAG